MNTMQHNRWKVASLLVALAALLTTGCENMLEENPASTLTTVNFYRNGEDAVTALNGAYAGLQYYVHSDAAYMLTQPSGQMINRRARDWDIGCFDTFSCNAGNETVTDVWREVYQAINRANAVLDNVPEIENMDAGERTRIVAEARFIRALHYFNLVRLFGGVPLFQQETARLDNLAKERSTADEIYDFIISDLEAAKGNLPPTIPAAEYGRATQGAARTLLGKVYLQRGVAGQANPFGDPLYWPTAQASDIDNAITEFRAVMTLGYSLADDYGVMWEEGGQETNPESIFSVVVASIQDYGAGLVLHPYAAPLFTTYNRGWAAFGGELPFFESYEEGDLRKDVTWLSEFVDSNGDVRVYNPEDVLGDNYGREFVAPAKFVTPDDGVAHSAYPMDFVVLRYGDVLLSLAEALWHQNPASTEALELVNEVRDRADVSRLNSLTEEALYWERNWELATEYHAWFDAPRFWSLHVDHMMANAMLRETQPEKYVGQSVPRTLPETDEPRIYLLPIPQGVIDLNPNLTQNPGY